MKPYIICYMMTSIDGRIDCGMTAQLPGVDEYYRILDELDIPTTLSGRSTAELEMALPGKYEIHDYVPYNKDGFSKKADAPSYEVIVDTKGSLLLEKEMSAVKPHLIVTSRQVSKEYLDYLDGQNISWIVCGENHIDLSQTANILAEKFGVKRMGIVGGPTINTAFLESDLLDEVNILIGLGIDGRAEMPSVFEGRKESEPLVLTLKGAEKLGSGTVLLRYKV